MNVMVMGITGERNVQGTDNFLQDVDRSDGHYITLFAEQLTRTFEVLVNLHVTQRFFRTFLYLILKGPQ